jgi:DNA-binding IclR family transcriptional regulator
MAGSETDGVAAVERALAILDAFTDQDSELTLAELAKRTKMYKSTILRLARSLESRGYLMRAEDGNFRLGSRLLALGSLYQRHLSTADFVPAALRAIVEELKEGASYYVRDGDKRLCLHRVDAIRSVRDSIHAGDRLPLNVGAAGHVICAFSEGSGANYARVRAAMHAVSFGERDPEVAAVACPVFGLGQRLAGALAVSGPRYRIEAVGATPILRVLLKHAYQLTVALGGNPEAHEAALAVLAQPKKGSTGDRPKKSVARAR